MDFLDAIIPDVETTLLDMPQMVQDLLPEGLYDNLRQLYGETLSDDMIMQSIEDAGDFFHADKPALVIEDFATGVYPLDSSTLNDDVVGFNREQLLDMGITGKDGLDLVMTHEWSHRMLQGMDELGFDSHTEELCCDYMSGVRAGLNNIDVSQIENALIYTDESITHPAGTARVEAIEEGVRFAQEYYAEYNMAPTFNACLEHFMHKAGIEGNITPEQINLRPDDNISFEGNEHSYHHGYHHG